MKLKSNRTETTSRPTSNYTKKDTPKIQTAGKNPEQKSNPNRKVERLERAKKYAKQYTEKRSEWDKQKGERDDNYHKRGGRNTSGSRYEKDVPKKKERDLMNKLNKKRDFQSSRFDKKPAFKKVEKKSADFDRNDKFDRTDKVEKSESKYTKRLKLAAPKPVLTKNKFPKKGIPAKLSLKPAALPDTGTRLNKYLANSGVAARRKCDEIIAQGFVKVNNKVVLEMGYKVMPGDKVSYRDKLVKPTNYVYILLNKPKDFLTTVDDEKGRRTVMELIANATNERVYPVGRLDRNTTGLLLLTNDGDLAQKLAHPSFGAKKIYEVELDKPVSIQHMNVIREGVELEDGVAYVDGIDFAHATKKNVVGIELHIGKNRIVRRIFEHLGYNVERLDRTLYAGLTKRDLPRGRWRMLTEREIIKLKYLQ
ncbi:MAG: pseudouridine synthase [Chitinophagaceae bacterium]|nr:pseudouridine synthase [Chitinophagales bacterium]